MKVVVTNHQNGRERLYEGTADQVEAQVLFDHPFLRLPVDDRGDLSSLLERLDHTAAFQVDIEDDDGDLAKSERSDSVEAMMNHPLVAAMSGWEPREDPSFVAARFMAGAQELSPAEMRQALYDEDGSIERAALRAYGFPIDDRSLKALRGVRALQEGWDLTNGVQAVPVGAHDKPPYGLVLKSEPGAARAGQVVAAQAEGEDVAEALRRAYADSFVFELVMHGKHSKGALLAFDAKTASTWILKPGSGGAGVAAGATEQPASPSQREAAWYHIAKQWGLWKWFPRAELVFIDNHQYAAIRLLPWTYKTIEHRRETDPAIAREVFSPLLDDGVLHQLAILYFVLGDPDAHGQNVMVDDDKDVRFIDHGSAFAGPDFDPSHDKASFVPYLLRAWAPRESFNRLPDAEKLQYLPRVDPTTAARIGRWLSSLSPGVLEALCTRYGIDPAPELDRLAKVKALAATMPVDEAINRLWVTT